MEENKQTGEEANSLENLEEETKSTPKHEESPKSEAPKKSGGALGKLKGLTSRLNIYFLMFMVLLLLGVIIFFVVFQSSQKGDEATVQTQELTQESVDELIGTDAKVGDPKQILTVESDSVFTGKVLIRDGLDVAGPIKVGGSLSLPGITVSGNSAFDEVTINTLNVAGDVSIQGQLSIQEGLTVSGPVTFSGTFSAASFSIQSLQVDQELLVNRHIDAGGPTPGVSGGGAVGAGGTVTISGTDTAGTVTINKGAGGGNGALASVSFSSQFNGSPHVVITPVTSNAALAGATYYLSSRTSSGFTISVSGMSSTGSISFDYIVID